MRYTKAMRLARFYALMENHGFEMDETRTLINATKAINRWWERTCGTGDGKASRVVYENGDGKAYERIEYRDHTGKYVEREYPVRHMGKINQKKIADVMAKHPGYRYYDGYIIRPGDVKRGDKIESVYTRGLSVLI